MSDSVQQVLPVAGEVMLAIALQYGGGNVLFVNLLWQWSVIKYLETIYDIATKTP